MSPETSAVESIAAARCISLTTFKRDGTARVLPPEQLESVMVAKKRRYFTARIITMLPGKKDQVAIEIVADAVAPRSGS